MHRDPRAPVGEDGTPASFAATMRRHVVAQEGRWEEAADPDCRVCHGSGKSHGYIGPGKTATYPCSCTGLSEVT